MDAQAARIKTLQEENAKLSERLSETQVQYEHLKQWSLNAQNYQLNAEELWHNYIEPQKPAHRDFAALGGTVGVVFLYTNPNPATMGADRVAVKGTTLFFTTFTPRASSPCSRTRKSLRALLWTPP